MAPLKRPVWTHCAASIMAATAMLSPLSATEYPVASEDVLLLRFVGASGMTFKVPIEAEGSAWLPILGTLPIACLPLNAMRTKVADAYSVTSMTFETDGTQTLVDPNQIFIGVAQYRRNHVESTTGPSVVVDYHPGLTLWQVTATARAQRPRLEGGASTWRSTGLLYEMTQIEARIWRLRAMLEETDPERFAEEFADRSAEVRRLAVLERTALDAMESEREATLDALDALGERIRKAETRLAALVEQLTHEEEVRQQDDDMVANIRELSDCGLAPTSRIADARLAALSTATRVLKLNVEIDTARGRIEDFEQEAAKLLAGNVNDIRSDLVQQVARYQRLSAELTNLRSFVSFAEAEAETAQLRKIRIIRANGEVIEGMPDDTSVILMPGDVVELPGEGATPLMIAEDTIGLNNDAQ